MRYIIVSALLVLDVASWTLVAYHLACWGYVGRCVLV